MSGPEVASSSAALSRTVRVIACAVEAPPQSSPRSGPSGLRARVGLSPKRPQHDAGTRMEPPPSLACAIGSIPEATAAAAPPLEPPALCARFQGLRVAPNSRGSVDGQKPSSGVLVLPKITRPARLRRAVISLSWSARLSANSLLPQLVTAPLYRAPRSFRRYGTPVKGPAGSPALIAARASS